MRKIIAIIVLATFVVLALTTPVFAAPSLGAVERPQPVKLVGRIVYSNVEGPHYELLVFKPPYSPGAKPLPVVRSCVLLGRYDFGCYVGRMVEVEGFLSVGPSIYMKPVLYVYSIKLLSSVTSSLPLKG